MSTNLTSTAPFLALPASTARWQYLLSLRSNGPSHPNEWWLHEIIQFFSGTPNYTTISYDVPALMLAFNLLKTQFPTHISLSSGDIFCLVEMLPIRHGEVVEKKLLLDLMFAAGKELGMRWWCKPTERMMVFWGIMLAGLILRRVESGGNEGEEELVGLLGKMDLGIIQDGDIMDRLGGMLERGLTIGV